MRENVISVSDLTLHIKAMVEGLFPSLWVEGEISDLVKARSGHYYFTLKDDSSQIRGVMWRSSVEQLKFDLSDGQAVLCFGNLEVYSPRGTYQLVVRRAEPQGIGALQLAFRQLQAKLQAEGLFDEDRKKPLPAFPRRIGIVTSPSGAAVRDFLQAASNRFKGAEIIVIPALVQGQGAARTIVSGIKAAQRIAPSLDLLIVSRGGGSLEDLWCFNEEAVVRAIARCKLPTISAVGHEIDVTLSDMAADVRALTPTDAATHALPDGQHMQRAFDSISERLHRSMRLVIGSRKLRLDSLTQRPILAKPHAFLQLRSRRLDELDARARRAMRGQIQISQSKLATIAAKLSALSPLNVLTRGYSVTMDAKGNAVTDANDVAAGDTIHTRLENGEIKSIVAE